MVKQVMTNPLRMNLQVSGSNGTESRSGNMYKFVIQKNEEGYYFWDLSDSHNILMAFSAIMYKDLIDCKNGLMDFMEELPFADIQDSS